MKPLNIEIDFDMSGFNIGKSKFKTRYVSPTIMANKPESAMKYSKAVKFVNSFNTDFGFRHYSIVQGDFCFGDMIEALIVERNWFCEEMYISTLSLNENNADSLDNLFNGKYLKKLGLVVSAYFYSHERQKNRMIDYLLRSLDKEDRFDIAVLRSHCKICQFVTNEGHHIVIHGSANLRSNQNNEQLMIEDNKTLYDFNKNYHLEILKNHSIINKDIKK